MPNHSSPSLRLVAILTTFSLRSRRLFLYTSRYALQLQPLDLEGQFDQLRHPEQRASRRHCHKPINPARIGPTRWQRLQTTFSVLKPDPILSPIPTAGYQLKLPLEQRMVGMRYSESSLLSAPLRRI
jgi:hypothetical protein